MGSQGKLLWGFLLVALVSSPERLVQARGPPGGFECPDSVEDFPLPFYHRASVTLDKTIAEILEKLNSPAAIMEFAFNVNFLSFAEVEKEDFTGHTPPSELSDEEPIYEINLVNGDKAYWHVCLPKKDGNILDVTEVGHFPVLIYVIEYKRAYGDEFYDLQGSEILVDTWSQSILNDKAEVTVSYQMAGPQTSWPPRKLQEEAPLEDITKEILEAEVHQFLRQLQIIFGAYPCNYEHGMNGAFCNNVDNPGYGSVGHPMLRMPHYDPDPRWLKEDPDTGAPADMSRPSARKVSNHLMHQTKDTKAESGANMLFVTMGQFIDHDITATPVHGDMSPLQTRYDIKVHPDDYWFAKNANNANCKLSDVYDGTAKMSEAPYPEPEPAPSGGLRKLSGLKREEDEESSEEEECYYPSIRFFRSEKVRDKGGPYEPFNQFNSHTAYLDLSQVYGNAVVRSKVLRAYEQFTSIFMLYNQDGKMLVSKGDYLPYNGPIEGGIKFALMNDHSGAFAYVAGDSRVNEQPYLTLFHTLWVREHNKVAYELKSLFPYWKDEKLFQEARKITIAEYQSIIYNEWLPMLLGPGALDKYKGYKNCVNPGITSFFSTAAFRFGHSMVTKEIKLVDYYWRQKDSLDIEDTFFTSKIWNVPYAFDYLMLGGAKLHAEEMDRKVQNALRNHLFSTVGEGEAAGFDLCAANIQRGRDHAIPSYTAARKNFHLPVPKNFYELGRYLESPWDAKEIEKIYGHGSIHNLDVWPIGLMEKKVQGSMLGPLFSRAIKEQFVRLRDGDRFHYLNMDFPCAVKEKYHRLRKIIEGKVTIKEIFLRNFDKKQDRNIAHKLAKALPSNMFLAPGSECDSPLPVLKPSTSYGDTKDPQCPYGVDRVKRFFWDHYDRKASAYYICDLHDDFVDGRKGFHHAQKAYNDCDKQYSNRNVYPKRVSYAYQTPRTSHPHHSDGPYSTF